MNHDPKLCETCPWPLECCTEDGAPKPDPLTVDCPRAHEVWERRLGGGGLEIATTTSMPAAQIEEEMLV
jgi:hypothetical protein